MSIVIGLLMLSNAESYYEYDECEGAEDPQIMPNGAPRTTHLSAGLAGIAGLAAPSAYQERIFKLTLKCFHWLN